MRRRLLLIGAVVILFIAMTFAFMPHEGRRKGHAAEMTGRELIFQKPVGVGAPDGVVGYEPGLAVDSTGALYYTAHKDLQREDTWQYLASWFFISTDNGQSWSSPTESVYGDPATGQAWKLHPGDEGDIAVDARDYVYFVDTHLDDNAIHVWKDQGKWVYSRYIMGSLYADDRPWITAQDSGILSYLGNNGFSIGGARIWYYRSDDGGQTWSTGIPFPGGWASIQAERYGQHVYVAQEQQTGGGSIIFRMSDDTGLTWNDPITIGPYEGNGIHEGWPVVSAGENGVVYVIWQDSPDGAEAPASLYLARSQDYGRNFEYWNITPFDAIFLYPTIYVGPSNRLGLAFYATKDVPVDENSVWYLYGALVDDPVSGTPINWVLADPDPVYTGNDLHALHDFFEITVGPDGALNIAYQHNRGQGEEDRRLYFVRGYIDDRTQNAVVIAQDQNVLSVYTMTPLMLTSTYASSSISSRRNTDPILHRYTDGREGTFG